MPFIDWPEACDDSLGVSPRRRSGGVHDLVDGIDGEATAVNFGDGTEYVLDPKLEATYRRGVASAVGRMLEVLPPREVDGNDVVPVFGDIKTLRDAIVELESRITTYRQWVAHHTQRDTRGNSHPRFVITATAPDTDGETSALGRELGCDEREHLRILTIGADHVVLEVNFAHDSSPSVGTPASSPACGCGDSDPTGGDATKSQRTA